MGVCQAVVAAGQEAPGTGAVGGVLDAVTQAALVERRQPAQLNAVHAVARRRGQVLRRARFRLRGRLGSGIVAGDAVLHRGHPVIVGGSRRQAVVGVGRAAVAAFQDGPGAAVGRVLDAVAQAGVGGRREPAQVNAAHDVTGSGGEARRLARPFRRPSRGQGPRPGDAELVHRPHPVGVVGLVNVHLQVHVDVIHYVLYQNCAVALHVVVGHRVPVHPRHLTPTQDGDAAVPLHAQRTGRAGRSRAGGGTGARPDRSRIVALVVVVVGSGFGRAVDDLVVVLHALDGRRNRVAAGGSDQGKGRPCGPAHRAAGVPKAQVADGPDACAKTALAGSPGVAPFAGDGLSALRHASQLHFDAGGSLRSVVYGHDGVGVLARGHLRARTGVVDLQLRHRTDVEGVSGGLGKLFGGAHRAGGAVSGSRDKGQDVGAQAAELQV